LIDPFPAFWPPSWIVSFAYLAEAIEQALIRGRPDLGLAGRLLGTKRVLDDAGFFSTPFKAKGVDRTFSTNQTKKEGKDMTDFQAVRETVESRFSELQPVDRYGQLNQFRFKVAERDKPELIPFSGPGPRTNGPLVLKDHALRQLCTRIGVPYSFFNKCPPALQEFNVAWFMQNMDKEKDVMLRIVKGNEIRAIVSDRYAPFDDIELFRILADFMDGTEEVVLQEFTEIGSHVRITWPTRAEEVQPGDIVEQGIHIANSEVGVRSVTIIGVVHRLKCKNGLIAREKKGGFRGYRHIGDPERIRSNVKQVIEDVKHDSEKLMVKFRQSLVKEIAQPIEMIDRLAADHELSKEEYEAILSSFMNEPSKNLFGVVNAVSNSAQRCGDADRRFEIESLASNVLDTGLTA
jgi:hypothetical protein